MVAKKRKSKRQTLQQKFKIQKRSQQHKRRLKKGAIVGKNFKKAPKDSIPNAWPYKEDLLKEIVVAKEKMEELRLRQKEKRHEEMMKRRGAKGDAMDTDATDADNDRVKNALSAPADDDDMYSDDDDEDDGGVDVKTSDSMGQNSRRAYLRELRKVVNNADVILHVLDARDPLGTRSSAIQDMVLSDYKKKLVYVLNKSDLVPRDALTGWLTYLRQSCPTVPFKSNTQQQKGNLGRTAGKVVKQQEGALQTTQAIGADELLGLLKNYCRVGDTKSIISVGIVGFPNVGKSSVINSLMRTRAVGVSPTPGYTKVMQEVVLDKNIRLLDSPGIVFADGDSLSTALRNCVNVEDMIDVITPVQAILERCPQSYLMQLYSIPKFKPNDSMGFLSLVAKATGRLKKGGVPNTDAAARSILHDWNNGKIKFYCKPPKVVSGGGAGERDTAIVSSFSKAFDIEDADIRVLQALEAAAAADTEDTCAMDGVAMDFVADNLRADLSEDGSGGNDSMKVSMETSDSRDSSGSSKVKKAKKVVKKSSAVQSHVDEDESVPSVDPRKLQKMAKKKAEKEVRRQGGNIGGSNEDEDYDFSVDYK